MSKRLAIRGHSSRGKEVIELLEMMGGKNIHKHDGCSNSYSYYIFGPAILHDRLSIAEDDDFEIFTLDGFLEKFPYKVGDKVHIYVQNDDTDGRCDIGVAEITSMRWNPTICKIAYKMKNINREFYKEEIKCKVDDSNKPTKIMGKKIAIQGHRKRNNEVIGLLEMLGGRNVHKTIGNNDETFYYIDDKNNIDRDSRLLNNNRFTIFTLEEFLVKYPFKVGDKVADGYGNSLTIKSMAWSEDYETLVYDFESSVTVLTAEDIKAINNVGLKAENIIMNIEFDLTKYSYEVKDGRLVVSEKKPKYPTTYTQCCEVIANSKPYAMNEYYTDVNKLLQTFQSLLICHNAYCKIASEKMGLDGPWKPGEEDEIFIIGYNRIDGIYKSQGICTDNFILSFPTVEMRDAFYDNFKKEIERCKELL